jgi:uncharacterized protein (DUF433 family)
MMSAIITPSIKKTPGVCGGDARVAGTRIPVWLLVGYRKDGVADAQLLEMYPSLTPGDLSAAWWHYAEHRDEIAHAIREQEAA